MMLSGEVRICILKFDNAFLRLTEHFLFKDDGTSTNPCADNYGGASAASEKETQAAQV